jgi:adenylosuccinate lyase
MQESALMSLSPLDGRYRTKVQPLAEYFSEYALIKKRFTVEVHWLLALAAEPTLRDIPAIDAQQQKKLLSWVDNFSLQDAIAIKEIEKETRHDVKAVEYDLVRRCKQEGLSKHLNFVHVLCTSEDINNLAYALLLQESQQKVLFPKVATLLQCLQEQSSQHAEVAMLGRTHGQPASPTTFGKELCIFHQRLQKIYATLQQLPMHGKINGAVGNYNAHHLAYPECDWLAFSQNFVESFDLCWQPYTTQIEPHDGIVHIAQTWSSLLQVIRDLAQDLWGYMALGYMGSKVSPGQVGSSTMPHKVNPIDFENAEGNCGLATALWNFMAYKLPVSRWQRDLSDSTVLRNIGVALGHSFLAIDSMQQGLLKMRLNTDKLASDLDAHWEILAEGLQSVMRRYGCDHAYETLLRYSQGKQLDQAGLHALIQTLDLPVEVKDQLMKLRPRDYIGYASKLVDHAFAKGHEVDNVE